MLQVFNLLLVALIVIGFFVFIKNKVMMVLRKHALSGKPLYVYEKVTSMNNLDADAIEALGESVHVNECLVDGKKQDKIVN